MVEGMEKWGQLGGVYKYRKAVEALGRGEIPGF